VETEKEKNQDDDVSIYWTQTGPRKGSISVSRAKNFPSKRDVLNLLRDLEIKLVSF
jgi:hypothetical protein